MTTFRQQVLEVIDDMTWEQIGDLPPSIGHQIARYLDKRRSSGIEGITTAVTPNYYQVYIPDGEDRYATGIRRDNLQIEIISLTQPHPNREEVRNALINAGWVRGAVAEEPPAVLIPPSNRM